ncbi:MAG: hypothetical protein HZB37_06225 [Planctomycetes bacterium]|nr:hypothetical protein [Planctomycetota bacterium]
MSVYDQVKQALQDVVAPEIKALQIEIKRLDEKIDTRFSSLEEKVNTRFASLDEKIDTRFNSLDGKVDSLRREMIAEIKRLDDKVDFLDEKWECLDRTLRVQLHWRSRAAKASLRGVAPRMLRYQDAERHKLAFPCRAWKRVGMLRPYNGSRTGPKGKKDIARGEAPGKETKGNQPRRGDRKGLTTWLGLLFLLKVILVLTRKQNVLPPLRGLYYLLSLQGASPPAISCRPFRPNFEIPKRAYRLLPLKPRRPVYYTHLLKYLPSGKKSERRGWFIHRPLLIARVLRCTLFFLLENLQHDKAYRHLTEKHTIPGDYTATPGRKGLFR